SCFKLFGEDFMDLEDPYKYNLNALFLRHKVFFEGLVGELGIHIAYEEAKYLKLDEVAKLVSPNQCGYFGRELRADTIIEDVRIYGEDYESFRSKSLRDIANKIQTDYPKSFLVGRRIGSDLVNSHFNGKLYIVRDVQKIFPYEIINYGREMWK
ncbi:MAG: hypothetical protein KC589_11265, partial [Nanoarchaeota archaeon]|nr:hypothetical protein [Nanoarchaeota archaeon]